MKKILLPLLAIIAHAQTSESPGRKLHIENSQFRDTHGRHVILHGTNVVYKIDPFLPDLVGEFDPERSLTDADLDDM